MPSVQNRRPNPLMPPVPPGVTPPTVGPGSAARAFNETVVDPALRAKVNPNSPVSPPYGGEGSLQRAVGDAAVAGGNFQPPAPIGRPGVGAGANLQGLLEGTFGSWGGKLKPKPGIGPVPPPGLTPRPDFPTLGTPQTLHPYTSPSGTPMLGAPPAPVAPPLPPPPPPAPAPYNGAADPEFLHQQGAMPASPQQLPGGPPGPQPYYGMGPGMGPPMAPPAKPSPFSLPDNSKALIGNGPAPTDLNLLKAQNAFRNSPAPRPMAQHDPLSTAPGTYAETLKNGGGLMDNQEAQIFQKNTGYMPGKTVGGNFGGPSPTTYAAGDQVLKDIAKDKINNASQPLNVAIGNGMLQGRGDQTQKPEHDFGLGTPFSDLGNKYTKNDKGQLVRGSGFSGTDEAKADAAKAQLASPERQAYLDSRKDTLGQRQANVSRKAYAKGDARAYRMDNLSNDERLAFENPQAKAYRDVGMAQANAAGQANQAKTETDRMRISAGERTAASRDAAHIEASKNAAIGKAEAQGQPNPFEKGSEKKPPSDATLSALKPQDAYQAQIEHGVDPSEAAANVNRLHKMEHNWVRYPEGPSMWNSRDNRLPPPSAPGAPPPATVAGPQPNRAPTGLGDTAPRSRNPAGPNKASRDRQLAAASMM